VRVGADFAFAEADIVHVGADLAFVEADIVHVGADLRVRDGSGTRTCSVL
jgi:hypothetical protein